MGGSTAPGGEIQGLLVTALLLVATSSAAQMLSVGDRIEPFRLEDQFEVSRSVDESVEIVLFSRDMDAGDVLEKALEGSSPDFLSKRRAVYLADISGMPGLVARLFAIPSMRKRGYPMLLDRTGEKTAQLPAEEGRATLVYLDELEITRLLHLDAPADVRRELGIPQNRSPDTEPHGR